MRSYPKLGHTIFTQLYALTIDIVFRFCIFKMEANGLPTKTTTRGLIMKKILTKAVFAGLALLCSASSFADATTTTVNTTLNLTGTCSFNQTNYPVTISGVSGTKLSGLVTMQIMCTSGIAATLTANLATISDGGSGTLQAIPYLDAAHTQPMNSNPSVVIADGGYRAYTVYLEFTDASNNGVVNKMGSYTLSLPTQVAY